MGERGIPDSRAAIHSTFSSSSYDADFVFGVRLLRYEWRYVSGRYSDLAKFFLDAAGYRVWTVRIPVWHLLLRVCNPDQPDPPMGSYAPAAPLGTSIATLSTRIVE